MPGQSESSIEAAIILTHLTPPLSEPAAWDREQSLRARQARMLAVGGVVLRQGVNVLYRIQGDANDIDRFLQLFAAGSEQSLALTIDRWRIPRRMALRTRLRPAPMTREEREWLGRQLTAPRIDARLIRLFTLWLDLRGIERDMGFQTSSVPKIDGFPRQTVGR